MRKIEVKSPNGGEEWQVGNSYQVKWEEQGNIGDVTIILRVYPKGPKWVLGTVKADKKDLKYFYRMYQKYAGYGEYKIKVVSEDGKVADVSNRSFTIKSLFPKKFIKVKPVVILYPLKRNQVCWTLGREYKVKIKLNGEGPVNLEVKLEGPGGTIECPPVMLNAPRIYYQPLTIPVNYSEGKYNITACNLDKPEDGDRTRIIARRRCR